MTIQLGLPLSLDEIVAVARGASVALPAESAKRMSASRAVVEERVRAGETAYGITTGFGSLESVRIDPADAATLQERIVISHATSVGEPLSIEETRAMLALRAHVLALGYSGVRVGIVERMVEMLDLDLIPVVPQQGSLGASGDLAPLARLALPLIGRGELWSEGRRAPAAEVLARVGLEPLVLQAKEGLALVNGTQGMLAVGILAAQRIADLCRSADVAAAMSIEALFGTDRPFDERLQALRPHAGQAASAANLRSLMAGSAIAASHRDSAHIVQDAYSLRCAPQVHGATRDTLTHAESVLGIEINAVSDNPVVFADTGDILSGGNFHGQPVAIAMDALAASVVSLASISERRLFRLLDPSLSNDLPPFLVRDSGLNSGFMLAQYTAASLVSESKSLAHPASIDSIPSSAEQEDHVSMGMTAARHARECVAIAEQVIALEVLCAAQALDLRAPLRAGAGSSAALASVRERVAFLEVDRELWPDIAEVTDLVRNGALVAAAEVATGVLL